jgi:N6-L-threonylcarbamoyladenine synthase
MRILAIETSCDETAISIVEAKGGLKNPRFKILENLVASQIKIHRPFGGIVPALAKREHTRNLPLLFKKIFGNPKSQIPNSKQISNSKSKILNSIDTIAVTVGPGLEPALWTGINFAKDLLKAKSYKLKAKLIGVSHLEGHLYSFLLNSKSYKLKAKNLFPAIALVVSGGHTILLKMDSLVKYKKIGETRDDAVGEAFDKVTRLLNLPYPGGPEIEKLAKKGDPKAINFPRPMIDQKNYDFSFSGLKTSVLYYLRDTKDSYEITKTYENTKNKNFRAFVKFRSFVRKANIAAAFQKAAFDVLIYKTLRAAKEFKAKSIMISGGVAANKTLQKQFMSKVRSQRLGVKFFVPTKNLCTDNAAMIAAAGYINFLRKKKHKLVASGNLTI